jgi:hypothetical protein
MGYYRSLDEAVEHQEACIAIAAEMRGKIKQLNRQPGRVVIASPKDGEPAKIDAIGNVGVIGEWIYFPHSAIHAARVCDEMNARWPGQFEVMSAGRAAMLLTEWYALFERMFEANGVYVTEVDHAAA